MRRLLEKLREGPGAGRDPPGFVVNDVKVPVNPDALEPQGTKPPGGRLALDRVDRHERDAQPRHHALLDRFGVVELHCHAELDSCPLKRAFGHAPGRRSWLPDEQGRVGE